MRNQYLTVLLRIVGLQHVRSSMQDNCMTPKRLTNATPQFSVWGRHALEQRLHMRLSIIVTGSARLRYSASDWTVRHIRKGGPLAAYEKLA